MEDHLRKTPTVRPETHDNACYQSQIHDKKWQVKESAADDNRLRCLLDSWSLLAHHFMNQHLKGRPVSEVEDVTGMSLAIWDCTRFFGQDVPYYCGERSVYTASMVEGASAGVQCQTV
jgi:hypothetical protein